MKTICNGAHDCKEDVKRCHHFRLHDHKGYDTSCTAKCYDGHVCIEDKKELEQYMKNHFEVFL